jgi:hypothetical protein
MQSGLSLAFWVLQIVQPAGGFAWHVAKQPESTTAPDELELDDDELELDELLLELEELPDVDVSVVVDVVVVPDDAVDVSVVSGELVVVPASVAVVLPNDEVLDGEVRALPAPPVSDGSTAEAQ